MHIVTLGIKPIVLINQYRRIDTIRRQRIIIAVRFDNFNNNKYEAKFDIFRYRRYVVRYKKIGLIDIRFDELHDIEPMLAFVFYLQFKPHGVQGVHLSETVKLFNRFGKEVVLIVR